MKGYRKLRVGELINVDIDKWVYEGCIEDASNIWKGDKVTTGTFGFFYRPIPPKAKKVKYSYIARIHTSTCVRNTHWVEVVGTNGQMAFESHVYNKRSYAIRQAKSFCDKVKGVKLAIEKGGN